MDPGVLCPNAVLEQIAWGNPKSIEDLGKLDSLRGWRLDALGGELLAALGREAGAAPSEAKRTKPAPAGVKTRHGRQPEKKPPAKQKRNPSQT